MKTTTIFALASFLALLVTTSCKKDVPVAPAEYVIEGTVDSTFNGKLVYLYDMSTRQRIDSVAIDSGKFAFQGIADTVRYTRASVERKYANFIIEEGNITVDFEKHHALGTPLNEAHAKFTQQSDSMRKLSYERYMALKADIKDSKELAKLSDSLYKRVWKPVYDSILNITFVANKDNILGMIIASEISMFGTTGRMDTILSQLSPDLLDRAMTKRMIERNDALKKTAVGQKFTDFTITQNDSTKVSLSDYAGKGKYVLVDFWASWCGPCRAEGPNLKELYKKYKGDKFEIVGVAVWDELKETLKAIDEDKMTWPQILDAKEIPTKLYGINGIPHIMLIAPDGTIEARDLRGDAMKAKIAEVLGK